MKHILIINQHGENRGDEAAMRAMLAQFVYELGEARFTLLYQIRDRSLKLRFKENVDAYPIVVPLAHYLGLLCFTFGKFFGVSLTWLLSENMRKIIGAYETADLVVSAPGGPYFGDLYANHEMVHWWYVWLGVMYRKPIYLYATSAGPFKIRLLNYFRKMLFRKFPFLVVREELSAQYLRELLGQDVTVKVTADAAIQAEFPPLSREEYFVGKSKQIGSKYLVAISLNKHKYPGYEDPEAMRSSYNNKMISLLEYLAKKKDCHFLFVPQLYGKVHSDASFLGEIGKRLSADISWEVVDSRLDSDTQRRLFAMCDLHIACRYHPAIFGNIALVPGLCIYYEHKALGFMRQLGLERFAFDINDLKEEKMQEALDELIDNREQLVQQLKIVVPVLQNRSRETTKMAVSLLDSGH